MVSPGSHGHFSNVIKHPANPESAQMALLDIPLSHLNADEGSDERQKYRIYISGASEPDPIDRVKAQTL